MTCYSNEIYIIQTNYRKFHRALKLDDFVKQITTVIQHYSNYVKLQIYINLIINLVKINIMLLSALESAVYNLNLCNVDLILPDSFCLNCFIAWC